MKPAIVRAAAIATFAFITAPFAAIAHPDDPKVLDRVPRYEGPGWRLADAGLRGGPGLNFESFGVRLMSWFSLADFGAHTTGNDCWGYVSPSGREYAIIGLSDGIGFVEVTDPGNAQIVGVVPAVNSLWHDIKVYGQYAYAVSEGGDGIQVISLANIDSGSVSQVRLVITGGTTATHNVAINTDSGYLYRCGGSDNGLRIYNLNPDPSNPQFVGQWTDRYVHDVQVVSYTSGPYAGREIAFACSGFNGGFTQTGLDVLDVTDKGNIQVLRNIQYPNPAYSHQAWLSPDRNYLYLDDELDEPPLSTTTHIINVSDPGNPTWVGSFNNNNAAVGHNLYTRGNLIFEANYASGLRIFDATNPTAPVEAAWFDTSPGFSSATFNGAWSNYPLLPSGIVLVSDIENGLFVLDISALAFSFPNGTPKLLEVAQPTPIDVSVSYIQGVAPAVDPNTVTLHVSINGGPESQFPMSAQGGNLFSGNLPGADCFDDVQWYVSAQNVNGSTYTDPPNAPAQTYTAVVADESIVFADAFEAVTGWTVGSPGDNATTGVWTRVNPVGTAAQPEDDHSDPGTFCFVTGQGLAGGGVGDNDVDGGQTTLTSPTFDATVDPNTGVSYWRWYSNTAGAAPNADVFVIDISNNNGASWTNLETVGPAGAGTSGGWFFHEVRVADVIAPTNQMRMRFIASDQGSGSIIEAAVDDFKVNYLSCTQVGGPCGDFDNDGDVDTADFAMFGQCFGGANQPPAASCPDGVDADCDGDGDVDTGDFATFAQNFTGSM